MDNEETIADLKQFISVTITQRTSHLATKDDIARLERKIDDKAEEILEAIGETMTTSTEATDAQLADHEQRLTRFEAKAA
jgi:hypothetical protein